MNDCFLLILLIQYHYGNTIEMTQDEWGTWHMWRWEMHTDFCGQAWMKGFTWKNR